MGRGLIVLAALCSTVSVASLSVVPAFGGTPTATSIEAPSPGDAASDPFVDFSAVACPASTSCVAVGSYSTGLQQGLVDTLTNGTWTAVHAPLPPRDRAEPWLKKRKWEARLQTLSCPAAGACVAAGNFYPGSSFAPILIERQRGPNWRATEAPLPGNASSQLGAGIDSLVCPTKHSCVGVGGYETDTGGSDGLIETLTGDAWSAIEAPLPGPGYYQPQVSFSDVSCPEAGNCVAVGTYEDENAVDQAVIETLAGGSWTATLAPLPADADPTAAGPLSLLSCPAAGSCVAVGDYGDSEGPGHAYAETLSADLWSPTDVPPPGSGDSAINWWDLTCPAVGVCFAPVDDADQNDAFHFAVGILSDGNWTETPIPLPDGLDPATHVSVLEHLVCHGVSFCVGTGFVGTDSDNLGTGLVATASDQAWVSSEPPLPGNAVDGDHTALTAVTCLDDTTCLLAGNYTDTMGNQQGLLVTVPDPGS